jgi:hypothetical protein
MQSAKLNVVHAGFFFYCDLIAKFPLACRADDSYRERYYTSISLTKLTPPTIIFPSTAFNFSWSLLCCSLKEIHVHDQVLEWVIPAIDEILI